MSQCGCPGSQTMAFKRDEATTATDSGVAVKSQLAQWPVQLHLINPMAPYFQGADVVLTADCVAYALGNYHSNYLKGKSIAIACPKLDSEQEEYVEKIKSWIDDAKINTLTVMIMQVPCCRGLMGVAQRAAEQATRKVPIKCVIVGLQGDIIGESWA